MTRLPSVLLFLGAAGAASALSDAAGAPRPVLPFVEDDYAGAMQKAQAKKLPVFVEAWAPW